MGWDGIGWDGTKDQDHKNGAKGGKHMQMAMLGTIAQEKVRYWPNVSVEGLSDPRGRYGVSSATFSDFSSDTRNSVIR